jgi:hypothetical protein
MWKKMLTFNVLYYDYDYYWMYNEKQEKVIKQLKWEEEKNT